VSRLVTTATSGTEAVGLNRRSHGLVAQAELQWRAVPAGGTLTRLAAGLEPVTRGPWAFTAAFSSGGRRWRWLLTRVVDTAYDGLVGLTPWPHADGGAGPADRAGAFATAADVRATLRWPGRLLLPRGESGGAGGLVQPTVRVVDVTLTAERSQELEPVEGRRDLPGLWRSVRLDQVRWRAVPGPRLAVLPVVGAAVQLEQAAPATASDASSAA
jgi:hypothetical protein